MEYARFFAILTSSVYSCVPNREGVVVVGLVTCYTCQTSLCILVMIIVSEVNIHSEFHYKQRMLVQ